MQLTVPVGIYHGVTLQSPRVLASSCTAYLRHCGHIFGKPQYHFHYSLKSSQLCLESNTQNDLSQTNQGCSLVQKLYFDHVWAFK